MLGTDKGCGWSTHHSGMFLPAAIMSIRKLQALDTQNVLVLGTDNKLWLEHPPWARSGRIPPREQVDDSVLAFRALDIGMY